MASQQSSDEAWQATSVVEIKRGGMLDVGVKRRLLTEIKNSKILNKPELVNARGGELVIVRFFV